MQTPESKVIRKQLDKVEKNLNRVIKDRAKLIAKGGSPEDIAYLDNAIAKAQEFKNEMWGKIRDLES